MQKVAVIIPTYNEEENIEQRISALLVCKNVSIIIVVDDSSKDNTQSIVTRMQSNNANLFLIARSGVRNFSQSYREGFKYALDLGAEILIQMDADGSHDEKYIDEMLRQMPAYDFVIGSRYVEGGEITQWGRARKILSWSGNEYARILLGVPFYDLTSGFNAWKNDVIKSINFSDLTNKGYVFLIWLKWNAHQKNFRGKEIPIIFTERRQGKSKLNYKIIFESLFEILKLYLQKPKE